MLLGIWANLTGEVSFAGLAPGYSGLYQVNVKLPDSAAYQTLDPLLEISTSTSRTSQVRLPVGGRAHQTIASWPADGNARELISGAVGRLVGNATFATGKINQAFNLNGTDSYVQATGITAISGPRTFTAWVFPKVNTGQGMPIVTGGLAFAADFLGISGTTGDCSRSGQYHLYIDHWGTACSISDLVLAPNTWSHIGVTYDGEFLRFYVNGVPERHLVYGNMYDYSVANFSLGGNGIGGGTTGVSLNGLLDEIHVFNWAMNESELAALP
ncbi:MAG: LamG-like jellyroll fold domain-containing protein [Acidobacteriota bacterium]